MSEAVPLWLKCTKCQATEVRSVTREQARPGGSAVFTPQQCRNCREFAAEPTTRAYLLSKKDREFLKRNQIRPEDGTDLTRSS